MYRMLIAVAIGLAGWGAWAWWSETPEPVAPALQVTWPGPDVGSFPVASNVIKIVAINPSKTPRRIIGMMAGCRPNVCFEAGEGWPITIPPGGTVECPVILHVSGEGAFECPLVVYFDDGGLRQVIHEIRGTGVAAGGPGHAQ